MAGDELSRIDKWITTKLLAHAGVSAIAGDRVFGELAPSGTGWPYVVFQMQAATDVIGQGRHRIMVDALYLVRGVHKAETFGGDVKTLADAITQALHAEAGATDDASIFSCMREQPYRLVELDDGGAQYRHAGGMFRILCQVP